MDVCVCVYVCMMCFLGYSDGRSEGRGREMVAVLNGWGEVGKNE